MLCYVGKATKIFLVVVAVLAAVGLFVGLGVARQGRGHKAARPGPCQGGGGDGPCSPITSLPATAAAVPPPPQRQPLPVGPAIGGETPPPQLPPPPFLSPPPADAVPAPPVPPETATAAAPPSPSSPPTASTPPSPVPPTATAAAPSPVTGQVGPGSGAQSPGHA